MDLKDAIRDARTAKKLTQKQLAKLLGVTQQAVSGWEDGIGVDEKHWPGIMKHLGVNVALYTPINQTVSMTESAMTQIINTSNNGNISVETESGEGKSGKGHRVYLNDIEFEILTLFRRYGNPTMLHRCLTQLRQAEAIFG